MPDFQAWKRRIRTAYAETGRPAGAPAPAVENAAVPEQPAPAPALTDQEIVLTLLFPILFIGGQTVGGIAFLVLAFLVLAFLVSPFGVPAIAAWLVDKLHWAKFALRDFITG